jgi:hypothetical protein
MDPQRLANLAPPSSDFIQEFEGFLRMVDASDRFSSRFRFQLETRAGRRLVYVDSSQLKGVFLGDWVDAWVNLRGNLGEVDSDGQLYVVAKTVWVAP